MVFFGAVRAKICDEDVVCATERTHMVKIGTFMVLVLLTAGCGTTVPVIVGSSPAKAKRACLAINEAMNHSLTEEDVAWCERNLPNWYAESRFSRADPADQYDGEAQLAYFRQRMVGCKRAADRYEQKGLARRNMLMRCLVISRR